MENILWMSFSVGHSGECWKKIVFASLFLLNIQRWAMANDKRQTTSYQIPFRHKQSRSSWELILRQIVCDLEFGRHGEEERENQITDDIPNKSLVVTVCYLMVL